jgi:hypothetical protein
MSAAFSWYSMHSRQGMQSRQRDGQAYSTNPSPKSPAIPKTPPNPAPTTPYREVAPLPALTGVCETPGPVDTVVVAPVALLLDPPPAAVVVDTVALEEEEEEVEKTFM